MKKTALFLAVVVMTVGRSLAQVYNWSTIAGVAGSTNSNDGSGSAARFNHPYSLAVDGGGNVYVTDTFNLRIRKAALAGGNWLVSTIWTNSTGSQGITVGPDGNLYLTDWACRVLRLGLVGTNSGMTVIAGGSAYGSADGTNGAAQFGGPEGLVADGAGTIYVADTQNHTIRKVAPVGTNWVVTTIAGSAGSQGTNDGVGSSARFN